MSDGNDCTLILLQMLLQPVNRLRIKVVGWLVEQQYIGLLKQQTTECHTTTLTTAQVLHTPVARRTVQGNHRTVEFRIHVPGIR